MLKQVLLLLSLFFIVSLKSQLQFYGGYGIGRYSVNETAPEILATKFNLGWNFTVNNDGCLIFFTPDNTSYSIEKNMNWVNAPHGMVFGTIIPFLDDFGMQLGMNWLNVKSSGKRTNLSNLEEENFSLKTRYAGFALNFVFLKNDFFQPYLGFDMGTTTFRFWYDNGMNSYKNEKLGYHVKFGGKIKPGDKSLTFGGNLGCFIKLKQINALSLSLQPNLQYQVQGSSEIFCGSYVPYLFNHTNFSLSFVAKYTIQ